MFLFWFSTIFFFTSSLVFRTRLHFSGQGKLLLFFHCRRRIFLPWRNNTFPRFFWREGGIYSGRFFPPLSLRRGNPIHHCLNCIQEEPSKCLKKHVLLYSYSAAAAAVVRCGGVCMLFIHIAVVFNSSRSMRLLNWPSTRSSSRLV